MTDWDSEPASTVSAPQQTTDYDNELKLLQVELVKLYQWIRNQGLKCPTQCSFTPAKSHGLREPAAGSGNITAPADRHRLPSSLPEVSPFYSQGLPGHL